MTPADLYINGIKKKLKNYYAAWLPNEKLRLGDVGILDGNMFTRVTSLGALGVPFTERADQASTPIDYVSEAGVSLFFKMAGEMNPTFPSLPTEKAGIAVNFNQSGAFLFKAVDSYEPCIENIAKLETDLLTLYRDGLWNSHWAVIIRLVITPVATIIVANSSNCSIELAAEGGVPVGGVIDLGTGGVDLTVKVQKGDILKFVGAKDLTPMFQLAKIKTRVFGMLPYFNVRTVRLNTSAMNLITPESLKVTPEISRHLYLDLIRDSDE
jgi:hypothetical protein